MNKTMTLSIKLALILALCCLAWAEGTATAGGVTEPLSLAVVPQFPATEIDTKWAPVLRKLAAETRLKFELKIYESIPKFEQGVLRGEPDFAYMNPYHAVMARPAGYVPLIRDGAQPFTGILVVRKDSPYKTVADLEGLDIAFPSPNSFGASLWIRALLREKESVHFNASYVKTHSNAYRHVLLGKTAAAGGVTFTLDRESREVRDLLRVLYQTSATAPHPLSAHSRIPESIRTQVIQAFLTLHSQGEKDLLSGIQMKQPVAAVYEEDYAPLEKLNLQKYVVLEP